MADLNDSLRKKAIALTAERDALYAQMQKDQARFNSIIKAIDGIDAVLKLDDEVLPVATAASQTGVSGNEPKLYDVLNSVVDAKARAVNDLVEIVKAKGVRFGDKDPYKTVNFTLIGMSRGKQIQRTEDGKWQRVN